MPIRPIRGSALAAFLALAACAEPPVPATTQASGAGQSAVPAPQAPAAPTAPAAAAQPGRMQAFPIFFEPWSANLDEAAHTGLATAAELARRNPQLPILVIGFADPRGSRQANVILSRLRAQIVADELVEKGVPRSRIRIAFRGPTPGFESIESRRVEVRVDELRRAR